MSFFSALGYGLGGYNQGRQQRLQDQREQATIDLEKQQTALDAARAQREAEIYQRSIAPVSPLPANLSQVSPGNKGRVPMVKDPTTGKMVVDQSAIAQQQIDHLYAVAQFYGQQPSDAARALADIALQRAKSLEAIYKQGQQNENILGREETMSNYRDTLPPNSWQQYQMGLNRQYGPPGTREPWGYGHLSPYQQWEEQFHEQHPPRGSSATPEQLNAARGQWYQDWAKLTKPGQSQLGIPTPPKISPQQANAASHLFSMIDAAKDPTAKAQELAQHVTDPDIKQMLYRRAKMDEMSKPAASTLGTPPSGGSDVGGPPPYRPY